MKAELKRNEAGVPYLVFTREPDGKTRSVSLSEDSLAALTCQLAEDSGKMTFRKYQELRRATDKYNPAEAPFCHALGLCSEAGEAAGKVDKMYRKTHGFNPDNGQREAIAAEIGDVLWYLAACADDIGYSLEDIAGRNIAKLADRDKRNQIDSFTGGDNR